MEFSASDFEKAAERVREMQRRAVLPNGIADPPTVPPFVKTNIASNAPSIKKEQIVYKKPKKILIMDLLNFDALIADKDLPLLAGILFLLSGEERDEILELAVLYLLI